MLSTVATTAITTLMRWRPMASHTTGNTSIRLSTVKLGPPAWRVKPMARQSRKGITVNAADGSRSQGRATQAAKMAACASNASLKASSARVCRAEQPGGHHDEHHSDGERKLAHHHPAPGAKAPEERVDPSGETAAFRRFVEDGSACLYSISHSGPPRRSDENLRLPEGRFASLALSSRRSALRRDRPTRSAGSAPPSGAPLRGRRNPPERVPGRCGWPGRRRA